MGLLGTQLWEHTHRRFSGNPDPTWTLAWQEKRAVLLGHPKFFSTIFIATNYEIPQLAKT